MKAEGGSGGWTGNGPNKRLERGRSTTPRSKWDCCYWKRKWRREKKGKKEKEKSLDTRPDVLPHSNVLTDLVAVVGKSDEEKWEIHRCANPIPGVYERGIIRRYREKRSRPNCWLVNPTFDYWIMKSSTSQNTPQESGNEWKAQGKEGAGDWMCVI